MNGSHQQRILPMCHRDQGGRKGDSWQPLWDLGPGSRAGRYGAPDTGTVGRLEEVVHGGMRSIIEPLQMIGRPALLDGADGVEIDHPIRVRRRTRW